MKTKAGITPHAAVNNLYIRIPEDGRVNVRNKLRLFMRIKS